MTPEVKAYMVRNGFKQILYAANNEAWFNNEMGIELTDSQAEFIYNATHKAKVAVLEAAKAKGPPDQSNLPTVPFFIEDKERGWTQEQLEERRWGWDAANNEWRRAIDQLIKEEQL